MSPISRACRGRSRVGISRVSVWGPRWSGGHLRGGLTTMSPFSHSAALTLFILGLSSPAAAQSTAASQSLDDPTALATFEALITYDIETAGIAATKSANADVREVASTFVQGHKGLLKQA